MKRILTAIALTGAFAIPAFAQTADPATMTCADFTALDAAGQAEALTSVQAAADAGAAMDTTASGAATDTGAAADTSTDTAASDTATDTGAAAGTSTETTASTSTDATASGDMTATVDAVVAACGTDSAMLVSDALEQAQQ